MATILLVHGAWHGSWCWAKVASLLQQAGQNVITLDMPGRAGDESPVEKLTLERYASKICAVAALQDGPAVAVGHSLGGMMITQAAEYQPESFAKLVYVCAFLPENGQSIRQLNAPDSGSLILPYLQPNTPAAGYMFFKEGTPFREVFYHDCAEADVRRAEAMLVPEAMAPSSAPVAITADRFGRIPRAYVECLQDRAIPLSLQRRMHAAQPCGEVASLDTSHSPFLSAPRELAGVILSVVGG